MYIFSLILNLFGTIVLAIPLIRRWRNLDDDLVISQEGAPRPDEDNSYYYTKVGFLKDRKLGLIGLTLLGSGFLIQISIDMPIDIVNFIKQYLDLGGLTISFIGALLIFLGYSEDKNEWVENEKGMKPGERYYSLLIKHPYYLKIGAFLLALGFICSFLYSFLK